MSVTMSNRKYRQITTAFVACATMMLSACSAITQPRPSDVSPTVPPRQRTAPTWNPGPGWTLTWSDDFNRTDSLRGWTLDSGGGGWGNQQLQDYSPKNVSLQPGGGLAITADNNGYGTQCWYGMCKYSSGLLKTKGLFQQQYGIFSALIKLPTEPGLWPAFWLEGIDASEVPWPRAGEIDVIEVNNQKSGLVEAFVHSPQINRGVYLQLPTSLSASYHVYSVEWTPKGITWLIDGRPYGNVKTDSELSFDQPFYLILDLAVGGRWPGPPTATTTFPAQMDVQWVRVYKAKS
jgi:beta-glucanase (GH16 family)